MEFPWTSWLFGMIRDRRWHGDVVFFWDHCNVDSVEICWKTSSNHLVVITGFYEIQTGCQRNNHGMKATDASERQLWFKNMVSNVQCPPIQCCFLPWPLRSIFGRVMGPMSTNVWCWSLHVLIPSVMTSHQLKKYRLVTRPVCCTGRPPSHNLLYTAT